MMWWQWHNFPRGGHTQANRFDALASESEGESSWESFEDLDNVEGDPSIYESGPKNCCISLIPWTLTPRVTV